MTVALREAPLETSAERRPGRGTVVVRRASERSVVTRLSASSPLRLLAPRNHGRSAWIYTSTFGGGLVDGDRITLDVEVAAGASAYVATQSATKVYRSPSGTSSRTTVRSGDGAVVVFMPDPVVCFRGARYRQVQAFEATATSSLVAVDWLVSGRYARGERWAFDDYTSRTSVHVDGRLVTFDGLRLNREDGVIEERLGRFEVLATILLLGPACSTAAAALVAHWGTTPCVKRADLMVTAAPLRDGGCLIRLASMSVERAVQDVRHMLDFVPLLLGDDPWQRKW